MADIKVLGCYKEKHLKDGAYNGFWTGNTVKVHYGGTYILKTDVYVKGINVDVVVTVKDRTYDILTRPVKESK